MGMSDLTLNSTFDDQALQFAHQLPQAEPGKPVWEFTPMDTGVHVIENGEDKEIIKFDSKMNTANIRNKNNIIYTREKSSGLLRTVTEIVVKNVQNNGEIVYSVDSTIKSVQVYENNIVINMGIEAEFISTNGWLQKKYRSSKEIATIVLGNSVAGVIYKDKIEIINL